MTATASDNILLATPTGAGVPVAQSCVDHGLQDSSAYAGNPYPGETVLALPGMLRTDSGQDIPDYPAHVASRHPAEQESRVDEQGYSLRASSDANSSDASARSGLDSDAARAVVTLAESGSRVDPDEGSATATARSDTQPLAIDDVLQLGRVRATASASVDGTGDRERESSLDIGRTTVAGEAVTITGDGVRATGDGIALPETDPAEALEAAGIHVGYLEESHTPHGVLSAGIEIVAEQQHPDTGATYQVRYVLGRAFAAAGEVSDTAVGGGPALDGAAAGTAAERRAAAGAGGTGPNGDSPTADGAPGDPGEATAPEGAEAPEQALAAPEEGELLSHPVDMGMRGTYLVTVLAALVMLTSATLLRVLGVRARWTS
ncbi:hypothetical protein [Haloechinothrix sp. LS1_15]|uniref:hypothetical protein n=1 Tax=Haloechinothrix sp. LS1_15 TaxID=2652248 RepID=UPI00294681A6|nr:hypothetical protein [Haloechinothrix sp. LS1_15]MDV6014602.1 hypothetical protein [Haloechinothrix sp. LS1_15]